MNCRHNNRALGFGLVHGEDDLAEFSTRESVAEVAHVLVACDKWPVLVSEGDCIDCAKEQWKRQDDLIGLHGYRLAMGEVVR